LGSGGFAVPGEVLHFAMEGDRSFGDLFLLVFPDLLRDMKMHMPLADIVAEPGINGLEAIDNGL
jgi:hypothetical protein